MVAGAFFGFPTQTISFAGAGLLAMVDNDNAYCLNERSALESIASKPAPTGIALSGFVYLRSRNIG